MSRYFENGGLVGASATNPYSAGSGIWSISGLDNSFRSAIPVRQTSVVTGLTSWYVASDFNSIAQEWPAYQSYGSTLSTGRGTIVASETTGNGATNVFDIISGNTSTGITIGALPSTFTLFHVTRYTGGGGRIMDGSGNNWLSGTWGGNTGVAYHDGWITQNSSSVHGSNWFISTDQNSLYRSNGVQRGTGGGGTSTTLTINNGNYLSTESSSWEVAEIMIYNRTLSPAEYATVELELSEWYGIAI